MKKAWRFIDNNVSMFNKRVSIRGICVSNNLYSVEAHLFLSIYQVYMFSLRNEVCETGIGLLIIIQNAHIWFE